MPSTYWTLKDYIISLFKAHKTETPEFQTMLLIYGREKIETWWREYQEELAKKHDSHKLRVSGME